MGDSLKLVTWNIWFGDFARETRLEALLEIVRREEADVIALQEVVPETHRAILATPWVRDGYHPSDPTGETLGSYGTLVLSRVAPERVHCVDLESLMGRKLVAVDLDLPGGLFRVGGMHLESMNYSWLRVKQLEAIFPFLASGTAGSVLMGDMNFDAGTPEEEAVPAEVVDVWAALHPGVRGATRDSESNLMAALHSWQPKVKRIDRVFLRPGTAGWRPAEIRILGDAPVGADPNLYPSDHFGLAARLER